MPSGARNRRYRGLKKKTIALLPMTTKILKRDALLLRLQASNPMLTVSSIVPLNEKDYKGAIAVDQRQC